MYTAEHLNNELHRLGVHFIADDGEQEIFAPLSPAELLAGLAVQPDARMRSAIIAVLLQFLGFSNQAQETLEILGEHHLLTFQLYFTATHFLQRLYFDDLKQVLGPIQLLPDLYSESLHLRIEDKLPDNLLKQLACRHQEITGLPINWYGTYHHAARRVISRLEKEKEWVQV